MLTQLEANALCLLFEDKFDERQEGVVDRLNKIFPDYIWSDYQYYPWIIFAHRR